MKLDEIIKEVKVDDKRRGPRTEPWGSQILKVELMMRNQQWRVKNSATKGKGEQRDCSI